MNNEQRTFEHQAKSHRDKFSLNNYFFFTKTKFHTKKVPKNIEIEHRT